MDRLLDILRKLAAEFIAAVEDYRGIEYDQSLLYRRRKRKELA